MRTRLLALGAFLAFAALSAPAAADPVPSYTVQPNPPQAGVPATFRSTSTPDPGEPIQRVLWDLDGDGSFDASGEVVQYTYGSPGPRQIYMAVVDPDDLVTARFRFVVNAAPVGQFRPGNRLPVAQFAASPLRPRVGEQVSLRSFSYDADGSIVSERWDLDGDGDFDENVNGPSTFTVFSVPGPRIVRLEVRDSSGAVQTATQTILVRRSGRAAASGVFLMNPFPVIRMAGSVYPRGALVKVLEAKAPRRSTVTARCEGASCPAGKITKVAKRGVVRFKRMRGFLRAGTVVSVAVRKRGQIGKYTRWLIRGGKLPKRKDGCLYPGRRKPSGCPPR